MVSEGEQGMTRRELAGVLCRLLALYFVYVTVGAMLDYHVLSQGERMEDPPRGPIAVAATAAVVLWSGAGLLARMMVSQGPLPSWPADLTPRAVLLMGLMLLGLVWMLRGGLELVTWVTLNVSQMYGGDSAQVLATSYVGKQDRGLFGSLLVFLAGAYLVFGGRGFVRFLGKLRDGVVWLRGGATEEELP